MAVFAALVGFYSERSQGGLAHANLSRNQRGWKEQSEAIRKEPVAAHPSAQGFEKITQEFGIGHDTVWKAQVEDFQNKSFNSESLLSQLHHPSDCQPAGIGSHL